MIAMLVSFIATIIVLVKLVFTDMNGGRGVKEGIQEGVRDAVDINQAIHDALNTDNLKEQAKEESYPPEKEEEKGFKFKINRRD